MSEGVTEPRLTAERLLLIATGALTVSLLPSWVVWLREQYAGLTVRIVLTRTAEQFVSRTSLAALSGSEVDVDEWFNGKSTPLHVELADFADAVAVFPAGMNALSRLALGLADTPSMMALQTTAATIGLAPALPPGAQRNGVFMAHLDALAQRPNIVVAPLRPAPSATTGRMDTLGNGSLPELLALIEARRQERATEGAS